MSRHFTAVSRAVPGANIHFISQKQESVKEKEINIVLFVEDSECFACHSYLILQDTAVQVEVHLSDKAVTQFSVRSFLSITFDSHFLILAIKKKRKKKRDRNGFEEACAFI